MRIVLDTNIIVSGLLVPEGTCGKVLRLLERPDVIALTSPSLLEELSTTLQRKIRYTQRDASRVVQEIQRIAVVVLPVTHVDVITTDPTDNRVLECAVDGDADAIVEGDKKHLLSLRHFRGIPLITAAEFLKRWT